MTAQHTHTASLHCNISQKTTTQTSLGALQNKKKTKNKLIGFYQANRLQHVDDNLFYRSRFIENVTMQLNLQVIEMQEIIGLGIIQIQYILIISLSFK